MNGVFGKGGKEIQRSIDPQSDHSRRQETIVPLKSFLKCGHCGGAMMPTYSHKGGRLYYYYICCKDTKRAILIFVHFLLIFFR